MVKQPDIERGPWMIRSFPVQEREKYVAHAQAQDETTAEWVQRACEELFHRENNAVVIGPADNRPDKRLDNHGAEERRHVLNGTLTMADISSGLSSIAQAHAAGLPVSASAAREASITIGQAARVIRGLEPRRRNRAVSDSVPVITGPLIDNS